MISQRFVETMYPYPLSGFPDLSDLKEPNLTLYPDLLAQSDH